MPIVKRDRVVELRVALKIAVMASYEKASVASAIMGSLDTAGYETTGIKFNASWRAEPRMKIDNLIAGASHVLFVIDKEDSRQAWLSYVVGLGRGRAMPLALFGLESAWRPEPWIADIKLLGSETAAVAYYDKERSEWQGKEERRMAKATLLELGISWHAESLAQCVREGDTKAVDLFISSGFPPNVRDKAGVPVICLAARSRHHNIVELLLERGADINAQSDDRGYSPLMDAAQQGDMGLLDILLSHGANLNLQSKDGQTALILAVGRSDVPMAAMLLERSADPELADKLGLSARKYAKLFNKPGMAELFAQPA